MSRSSFPVQSNEFRFEELRKKFLDGVSLRLTELQVSLDAEDWTTFRNIAHELNGAAAVFECDAIRSLAAGMELASRQKYRQTKSMLQAMLDEVHRERLRTIAE